MEPIDSPSPVATTTSASGETKILQDRTVLQQPHLPKPLPGPLYVAKYDYDALEDGNLSFKKDEWLYILDDSEGNWWLARSKLSGIEGYVPSNYIKTHDHE